MHYEVNKDIVDDLDHKITIYVTRRSTKPAPILGNPAEAPREVLPFTKASFEELAEEL